VRVRLLLDRATAEELAETLRHAMTKAGAPKLMTPELVATLCDHASGNHRALIIMADELLAVAAQREARHLSGEVATLLAYLRERELQRRHAVAVAVVHHAKKGRGRVRAGQALRGSSEFHAWGDSNLYLRRHGDDLALTVEHRAAASVPAIHLELAERGDALALEAVERSAPAEAPPISADERIIRALAATGRPMSLADLRAACCIRTATLCDRLATLTTQGRLVRSKDGLPRRRRVIAFQCDFLGSLQRVCPDQFA
jgi:hypothetical protein